MINLRKYGNPPFGIAVLHGGPGARGEMALVAARLSIECGVLEPLQTATSVDGQIDELKSVLELNCNLPVILIGHSWGSWLGFMLTSRYPRLVRKLILVGTGPFEEHYVSGLTETRLGRLSSEERVELENLQSWLNDPQRKDKIALFARFGQLMSKADSFDAVNDPRTAIEYHPETYERVWNEAKDLRRTGQLLRMGEGIQCPVLAIHGDYDPHPAEGVSRPLTKVLKDFRIELLKNCGHTPWLERFAADRFYQIILHEVKERGGPEQDHTRAI